MRRKAILISSGGPPPTNSSSAVSLWSRFLQSQAGGGWGGDQIAEALDWSRERLLHAIRESASAEYAFVVFLGRGQMVRKDVPWSQLELEVGAGETVLDGELNPGAPRCGMVMDATGYFAAEAAAPALPLPSASTKRHFEDEIQKAEKGLARIWVTKKSYSAVEKASSFSFELISRAIEWSKTNNGVLSFQQAVELASHDGSAGGRNIEYRGGRRNHDLPLALGLLE